MILKRVSVQNFRAIRNADVEFGRYTAILGGNGAGKSTILRAIDKFYSPQNSIDPDDFFGRDLTQNIEIALTFTSFNDEEQERFGDRIIGDEMTVTRVFEAGGGRNNGRYFGASPQYPAFSEIRQITGAAERRQAFNAVAGAHGLANARAVADAEEQMRAWEEGHPEACNLTRDDGQFFGFTNIGRGNLQKSTSFVFIPAVRDAGLDAGEGRNTATTRLMDLVVKSAIQRRRDVQEFQARVSQDYRLLVDPARLPELGGLAESLTDTLREFYAETGVELRWRPPEDFTVPLPAADVLLEEDGFIGPVDRKGHGLQRAFIVTLLQHLAKAGSAEANAEVAPAEGGAVEQEVVGAPEPYVLPGLILAIEEPELYQHPTKQRHLSNVLKKLSDGTLPGVAAQTQVMFASHSSLFVSLDRFDDVRLARRSLIDGQEHRECSFASSTLAEVASELEAIHEAAVGSFSAEILKSRLHIIGPELAEGFFADLVVLVEGISDKAAIVAAAEIAQIDLEGLGVAVLNCEGKTKIDRPAAIFRALGIPIYAVFDCDSAVDARKNRALQRLFGEQNLQDAPNRVTAQYSCFAQKVEQQLETELPREAFVEAMDEAKMAFGVERADVLKSPSAMVAFLRAAEARGHQSQMLRAIVEAIRDRRLAL